MAGRGGLNKAVRINDQTCLMLPLSLDLAWQQT